ncbi:transformer-2 protein homolog beta-like isoform X2 [Halichondria panicea]|uniref:transformer-2 protein homolog beta-like isoform X2 n=1 Tax=Halichondria panicea TaxID=6063 RepID=UPI00312B7BF3
MSRDKSPEAVYERSPSPSQSSRSVSPESPPRRRQSSPSPSRRRGRRASSSRSISRSPPPRSRGHHYRRRSYSRSRSRSRSMSPRDRRGNRGRYKSRSPMSERKRHQGNRFNPNPSRVLGVFGLSLYTGEKELKEMFDRYGPIERVQVVYDHQTGRSRGFSFIYFADSDDAMDAKEGCNGLEMDGRRIRVDFSITKRPHTPTPGVYMGRPTRSSPENDSHSRGSSDRHGSSRGGDDRYGRRSNDYHSRGSRGGDDRYGRGGGGRDSYY